MHNRDCMLRSEDAHAVSETVTVAHQKRTLGQEPLTSPHVMTKTDGVIQNHLVPSKPMLVADFSHFM